MKLLVWYGFMHHNILPYNVAFHMFSYYLRIMILIVFPFLLLEEKIVSIYIIYRILL